MHLDAISCVVWFPEPKRHGRPRTCKAANSALPLHQNPLPGGQCTTWSLWSYVSKAFLSFSSVQSFSHVRLFATPWTASCWPPCPSPTPGIYSNSCLLSRWCHPTISSSVVPFSSCLQSFPASGSFQMSQFFASGGQSIGVSASASVLPMNIQDWFPLGWTGWIFRPTHTVWRNLY